MRELLTPEGHAVVCCSSGVEALAEVAARPPDLVLLDVVMPKMNGFEVCERLRATPAMAEVPILILTALQDRESRLRGLRAGADDVLSRPIDTEELLARVRTIMRLNRYRRLSEDRQRLESLSRQLLRVQEQERRSLAMELHDEVGQTLTLLKLSLQTLRERHPDARLDADLTATMRSVDGVLQRIREMSLNLRPAMLDHLGLIPALRWLTDRQRQGGGAQVRLMERLGGQRLPPEVEIVVYRVVQEALANAARHAQAKRVCVWVWPSRGGVTVTVRDDGSGFDARAALADHKTFGLLGIQERVQAVGGRITITSRAGKGSTVRGWVPLAAVEKERGSP
jgi:signal transduction histidine kinase